MFTIRIIGVRMSIFEDIMNNMEEYPELGEIIPDGAEEKPRFSVQDRLESNCAKEM